MEEEGQEGVISQRKNVSGNIELTFSLKKVRTLLYLFNYITITLKIVE